jgi:hypothetical protein
MALLSKHHSEDFGIDLKDNIKMHLREMRLEVVDCIIRLKIETSGTLVNMVMKRLVP